MLFLFTLIAFKDFDCQDHDGQATVSGLMSLFASFKPKESFPIFGYDVQMGIDTNRSLQGYIDQGTEYAISHTFGCIPMILIAFVSFACILMVSTLCACHCVPHVSSPPGKCSAISYVIFTLFFELSITYYGMNIFYSVDFYEQFPRMNEFMLNPLQDLKTRFEVMLNESELHKKQEEDSKIEPALEITFSDLEVSRGSQVTGLQDVENGNYNDVEISASKLINPTASSTTFKSTTVTGGSVKSSLSNLGSFTDTTIKTTTLFDTAATSSELTDCKLYKGQIEDSNVINNIGNFTYIGNSNITSGTIDYSTIITGAITNAVITNGFIQNSEIHNSTIINSTILYSKLFGSKVEYCTIDDDTINDTFTLFIDNISLIEHMKCNDSIAERSLDYTDIIDLGIRDMTYMQDLQLYNLNGVSWKTIRAFTYIFFALIIILYIVQTVAYGSRNRFSVCFATAYPLIAVLVAIFFGALGIIVTGIAIAGQDICDNFDNVSNSHVNSWIAPNFTVPADFISQSGKDLSELFDMDVCASYDIPVTLPEIVCSANNVKANICMNFVPYFASASIFFHLYLISLTGFTFLIIMQRSGMVSVENRPKFGKIKSSAVSRSPRRNGEVLDQFSDDNSDSSSYRIDHNHVGYL